MNIYLKCLEVLSIILVIWITDSYAVILIVAIYQKTSQMFMEGFFAMTIYFRKM